MSDCCNCDNPTGRAGQGEDSIYVGEILGKIIDKQSIELRDSASTITQLKSDLAFALEALKPFADEMKYRQDHFGTERPERKVSVLGDLNVADLRRAAAELAKHKDSAGNT